MGGRRHRGTGVRIVLVRAAANWFLSLLVMRRALPLFVLSVVMPVGLIAKDPANFDASRQNADLAPTPANSDTPLSPGREANQRPYFRNEIVQEQRFRAPEIIERKDAIVGERRAPIDVTETRKKEIVERKNYPKPELRDHKVNRHDGEQSRIQPRGDMVKKYDTVTKYQDRMADAKTATTLREPKLEKRTSFEKLNRFIFKRNAPGAANGKPMVTPAGGGSTPPPMQDTTTQYRVDWRRMEPPK